MAPAENQHSVPEFAGTSAVATKTNQGFPVFPVRQAVVDPFEVGHLP